MKKRYTEEQIIGFLREALRLLGMSASTMRYESGDDGNTALRERLMELAGQHRRHGTECCTAGCGSTAGPSTSSAPIASIAKKA